MKKRNLKTLALNKKSISILARNKAIGGIKNQEEPDTTFTPLTSDLTKTLW